MRSHLAFEPRRRVASRAAPGTLPEQRVKQGQSPRKCGEGIPGQTDDPPTTGHSGRSLRMPWRTGDASNQRLGTKAREDGVQVVGRPE